jgi:hypothetical protein
MPNEVGERVVPGCPECFQNTRSRHDGAGRELHPAHLVTTGLRMAGGPGFDLADTATQWGAPSFAYFAKGGNRECQSKISLYRQHRYPPLQKTQGRGTHSFGTGKTRPRTVGHPPKEKPLPPAHRLFWSSWTSHELEVTTKSDRCRGHPCGSWVPTDKGRNASRHPLDRPTHVLIWPNRRWSGSNSICCDPRKTYVEAYHCQKALDSKQAAFVPS